MSDLIFSLPLPGCRCKPGYCCASPHPIHLGGLRHPELREAASRALAQPGGELRAYRVHGPTGTPRMELLVVGEELLERQTPAGGAS